MPDSDGKTWKDLHQQAIQEQDPAKASVLLDEAYRVIHDRLGELLSQRHFTDEQPELSAALNELYLRRQSLK
jgi:hypothetical protein